MKEKLPKNNTKGTQNNESVARKFGQELVDALNKSQSTPK